ncbi:GNAT family N-acetyltransferase [Alloscardovia omnicolens]|uniref:GNAT family N-acetyltransferase n=1 Tax=Alloscardovia omnicolens TaxID=419015 RepID=UPI003A637E9C
MSEENHTASPSAEHRAESHNEHEQNIMLRFTQREDLPDIMYMVNAAKQTLKVDGSSQWQNGYPNEYSFIADMDAQSSYVLTLNSQVVATASISYGEEAGYSSLRSGQWHYPEDVFGTYAVLHRVAVHPDFHGQGIVDKLFTELCEVIKQQNIRAVRVDTHRKNQRMQHVLSRSGFELSGEITIDHDPVDPIRLCYEKLLDE